MTSARLCLFGLTVAAAAAPLCAQTSATAAHHTTAAATHRVAATSTATSACAVLPQTSPNIPALPPGTPCVKPLFTITQVPPIKVDYISPLVGAQIRSLLTIEPTTYSLDYADIRVGTGALVQNGKYVSVQYTGYLTDGTVFDSSENKPGHEPFTFQYGKHGVIPGWDTGFEGMHVGGKRRLYIPYQLAYGERGQAPIPPKAMLVFDMEVVGQSDTEPAPKTPAITPPGAAPSPPAAPSGTPAPKPSGSPQR